MILFPNIGIGWYRRITCLEFGLKQDSFRSQDVALRLFYHSQISQEMRGRIEVHVFSVQLCCNSPSFLLFLEETPSSCRLTMSIPGSDLDFTRLRLSSFTWDLNTFVTGVIWHFFLFSLVVCRLVWLFGWLVVCLVVWLFLSFFVCLFVCLVGWLLGWLVGCLIDCLVAFLFVYPQALPGFFHAAIAHLAFRPDCSSQTWQFQQDLRDSVWD